MGHENKCARILVVVSGNKIVQHLCAGCRKRKVVHQNLVECRRGKMLSKSVGPNVSLLSGVMNLSRRVQFHEHDDHGHGKKHRSRSAGPPEDGCGTVIEESQGFQKGGRLHQELRNHGFGSTLGFPDPGAFAKTTQGGRGGRGQGGLQAGKTECCPRQTSFPVKQDSRSDFQTSPSCPCGLY